jgi:hypothetical protein
MGFVIFVATFSVGAFEISQKVSKKRRSDLKPKLLVGGRDARRKRRGVEMRLENDKTRQEQSMRGRRLAECTLKGSTEIDNEF